MYVYIYSRDGYGGGLYTVGFYAPDGAWMPESDHADKEDAARRVAWLNGESSHDRQIIKESLNLIGEYGGIDGSHHKQWLLDQLVRILAADYQEWVKEYEDGEDGPQTYLWEKGVAP